jgi:hypothetical protein
MLIVLIMTTSLTIELSDAGPKALDLKPRRNPGVRWNDFVRRCGYWERAVHPGNRTRE